MANKQSGRWLRDEAAREYARAIGHPEWAEVEWGLVDRGEGEDDWFAYKAPNPQRPGEPYQPR